MTDGPRRELVPRRTRVEGVWRCTTCWQETRLCECQKFAWLLDLTLPEYHRHMARRKATYARWCRGVARRAKG